MSKEWQNFLLIFSRYRKTTSKLLGNMGIIMEKVKISAKPEYFGKKNTTYINRGKYSKLKTYL
jgi:hypothetical protein